VNVPQSNVTCNLPVMFGFRSDEAYGEDNTVISIIRVSKYMETIVVLVIRVSSYMDTTVISVIGLSTYMETSHLRYRIQ